MALSPARSSFCLPFQSHLGQLISLWYLNSSKRANSVSTQPLHVSLSLPKKKAQLVSSFSLGLNLNVTHPETFLDHKVGALRSHFLPQPCLFPSGTLLQLVLSVCFFFGHPHQDMSCMKAETPLSCSPSYILNTQRGTYMWKPSRNSGMSVSEIPSCTKFSKIAEYKCIYLTFTDNLLLAKD